MHTETAGGAEAGSLNYPKSTSHFYRLSRSMRRLRVEPVLCRRMEADFPPASGGEGLRLLHALQ